MPYCNTQLPFGDDSHTRFMAKMYGKSTSIAMAAGRIPRCRGMDTFAVAQAARSCSLDFLSVCI